MKTSLVGEDASGVASIEPGSSFEAASLSVEQAAQRIADPLDSYRAVVVLGAERFTEEEIRKVLAETGVVEDRLRAWEQRPRGDTRNPARTIETTLDGRGNMVSETTGDAEECRGLEAWACCRTNRK